MYFPLIVHEALMIEPTETETKETLDEAAKILLEIYQRAKAEPKRCMSRRERLPFPGPTRRRPQGIQRLFSNFLSQKIFL
jgi:glycine dehydrogenase subunit 2